MQWLLVASHCQFYLNAYFRLQSSAQPTNTGLSATEGRQRVEFNPLKQFPF